MRRLNDVQFICLVGALVALVGFVCAATMALITLVDMF